MAPLIGAVAAVLLATRRRVIREFERRGAADASTAVHVSPSAPLKRWWLQRLQNAGVLKATGDGRRWLDEAAWRRYRAVRTRRALVVAAGLLALLALLAALAGLGMLGS